MDGTKVSSKRHYNMKLGILTSTATRHRYFALRLAEVFDVVAVGFEEVGYVQSEIEPIDLTEQERKIVADHFAERDRQEHKYFGDVSSVTLECDQRNLAPGTLNAQETLAFFADRGVDALAVFGTNLIKPPLLGHWPDRTINLHLGLSPYYRGTATNFYPMLNDELEYIGATIHLIDAGIDSGAILAHARPTIVADDRPHTIGCKAIIAGVEKMIEVLHRLDDGLLNPVPQWHEKNAKLYLRKDYSQHQVVELYKKIDDGLIERYVERARKVSSAVELVE